MMMSLPPSPASVNASLNLTSEQHTQQAWLTQLAWQAVDKATYKQLPSDEQLKRVRHSTAHVLATALQELYPTVQLAIGPATPTGFFYDVVTPTLLKEEDLAELEKRMTTLVGKAHPFEVATVTKAEAEAYFTAFNQIHKLDILRRLTCEQVTLYRSGTFVDLCAGPHVPHTGLCGAFKLTNIAGAHWHGEETPSLTRITGTSWQNAKDLQRYLNFVEDSKARDHRVLGPQLELFNFHPWAAGAMWQPKGVKLRRTLETYWRELLERYGYDEISNPVMYKKELFECSGHWQHYKDDMLVLNDEQGEPDMAIKPMNCPDTMLYYKTKVRSYRDLPMRIAEGQILHRNEATGAMHGLMRTRMFTQDDAHIFVRPDQVQSEVQHLFNMLDEVYSLFQLDYTFSISTRPEEFLGEIEVWNEAEVALKQALQATGRPFKIEEGEGAFYGPKIDIQIRDSLGRQWQCGTFQLDFQLPERFDLHFISDDGSPQRPIVIHRAIFGSFERFIGILIEHLSGAFPTWLAPIQVAVLPISADKHLEYAQQVVASLKKAGFRTILRDDESINYRVRQCETNKIPVMLVVGDREAEEGSVAVRRYKVAERQTLALNELISTLQEEVNNRALTVPIQTYADLFFRPSETLSTEEADY
ncbi:MAG: threonine--tRNA ligase [Vampirovibrionales bacterium]